MDSAQFLVVSHHKTWKCIFQAAFLHILEEKRKDTGLSFFYPPYGTHSNNLSHFSPISLPSSLIPRISTQ